MYNNNNLTVILKDPQVNILKRNLNKNNFFRSSVTNLRDVRGWSHGGYWCSVRKYHSYLQGDESFEELYYKKLERDRKKEEKKEEFNNRYKIN